MTVSRSQGESTTHPSVSEKTIEGLLDAVERLNVTLDRKEGELRDLRQIASLDPDALVASEERVARLESALRRIRSVNGNRLNVAAAQSYETAAAALALSEEPTP